MESESQNQSNPVETTPTSDSTTATNDEHKPKPNEASESSTDQSDIVDLIGNGQLVKKVCAQNFIPFQSVFVFN